MTVTISRTGGSRKQVLALLVCAAVSASGCTVEHELPLRDGGPPRDARVEVPDAGMAARLVWPAAGLGGVPINLDRVYLAPGDGVAVEAALLASNGQVVPTRAVTTPGRCGREARCAQLLLQAPLAAGARYALAGAPGQWFTTASGRDDTRPWLSTPVVRVADRCAVIELDSDEPVFVEARLIAVSDQAGFALPGVRRHAVGLPIPSRLRLLGDDPLLADVRASDLAGNETRLTVVVVPPAADLPNVVITEVLANPAGTEPTQEWIELLNLGSAVDVRTFELVVGGVADVLPPAILGSGERAIVVPAGFRDDSGSDPPPDARARVLRVADSALGKSGLANSGDQLELRLTDGRVLSRFGAHLDSSGSGWNGRSVERIRADACDVPSNVAPNRDGRSTPGARNSVSTEAP